MREAVLGGLGSGGAGALAKNLLLDTSTKCAEEEGAGQPPEDLITTYSHINGMKVLSDFRKQYIRLIVAKGHFKIYDNKFIFSPKLLLDILAYPAFWIYA